MRRDEKLLVVVLDGEHARFVRPSTANVLHTVRRFSAAEAHKRTSDLRSGRPGASFHSESTAHHALAPRHDPHELEKAEFVRFAATEINNMPEDEIDGLVIAAPAYALNIIEEALRPSVYAKLLGTLGKDLVKTPDDELWEHVKQYVPPATPPRIT